LAAQRRTRALIVAGMLIIVCDIMLMVVFRAKFGAPGIALAISAGSLVYAGLLLGLVVRELPSSIRWLLLQATGVILAGTLAMHAGLRSLMSAPVSGYLGGPGALLAPIAIGTTVYLAFIGICCARL